MVDRVSSYTTGLEATYACPSGLLTSGTIPVGEKVTVSAIYNLGQIRDTDPCMTCGHMAIDHHNSYLPGFLRFVEECEVYPECEVDCQQFIPYDRGYEDA